ncbi:MerC mercury resistance protein [Albibacterium bauzanense]|uniref:MerC mercury resistance protein n=2 Tax=Albibacterium bauzanense TaxID=653929 RepID=A0A4R1LP77_9SPHI|nr:MerC mercury resistance protein [Albibacterium bauzanense]
MGIESARRNSIVAKLDGVGFTASTLCAVHCALMPFVIAFLPLIGLGFLVESWVETSITAFSIVVGIGSLIPSYRKYHHNRKPLIILTIGFVLIFGAHFLGFHEMEPILVPLGGFCIAASHYFNWKLSKPYHGHRCDISAK